MKFKTPFIISACVAAIALCGSATTFGASKKASASPSASASPAGSAAASPAVKAGRAIPFHGTVSSVDASAKTFTITGKTSSRVFKVTDQTTVMKDGAAATIADVTADAKISGSYYKKADGSLECKTVKVGGATAASDSAASKKAKKDAATPEAAASASPSASPKK